jgi:hypothetical protein
MNQHGGLEMAQERERLPERYKEWDLYLNRPERRRFLVPLEGEEDIKKGLRARARDLHHFNCVFMQPLGWGGEGFAALFEHTRPDGSTRPCSSTRGRTAARAGSSPSHTSSTTRLPRAPKTTPLSRPCRLKRRQCGSLSVRPTPCNRWIPKGLSTPGMERRFQAPLRINGSS